MSGMLANIILIVLLVVIVGSAVWYIHKEKKKRRTLYWMPISRILYTLMYVQQKKSVKKIMQKIKGDDVMNAQTLFNRCHSDHSTDSGNHQYLEAYERGRRLLWRSEGKTGEKRKSTDRSCGRLLCISKECIARTVKTGIEKHLDELDGVVAKVNLNKRHRSYPFTK